MNKSKVILVALFMLVVSFFTFQAVADSSDNGNTNDTGQAPIIVELAKTTFDVNETLSGTLRLNLSEYLDPGKEIRVRITSAFKSAQEILRLDDALSNSSIESTLAGETKTLGTRELSKTLSFVDGGEHSIAVKIPLYADVESIDMDISAPGDSTLSNVTMDAGNDGTIDWFYLGDFVSWEDEYTLPEGLEDESEVAILRDNITYYCQIIDLPHSINYTLAVNYEKDQDGGNISAAILTIRGGPENPDPFSVDCDLPERTSTGWGTCTVETEFGLAGQNLVCVYSTTMVEGNNIYRVEADSGATETAYMCEKEDGVYSCSLTPLTDYLIKAKGAEYTKVLNEQIDFLKWQLFPDSVLTSFWQFVGSPEPHGYLPICTEPMECVMELKFIADGSGNLKISNLDIDFTDGGVVKETKKLYDIVIKPSIITHVKENNVSVDLNETGAIVEIPLSIFNITIPSSFAKTGSSAKVKVYFNGNQANASFDVLMAGEVIGSEKMIGEAEAAWDSLTGAAGDTGLALKILGLDEGIAAAKTELSTYKGRLAPGDSAQLQSEISSFRASLPKELVFEGTLIDMQYIEPDDITTGIVPADEKTDTYFLQEKVDVKVSISSFVVTDFSGTQSRYALVKKEITAKEALSKVDIYEVIDKGVVDSIENVEFEEPPSKKVKEDTVKWFMASLAAGSKKEVNYVVKTEFAVPIGDVKTIIAATSEESDDGEQDGDEVECGDGVCTSILEDEETCPKDCKAESPIYTIALILVIALILGLYMLFYKGKYSLQALFKKKTPFKSESEINSVKTFIKNSREKKMSDIQIKKRLLNKGWTAKQISHVFSDLGKKKMPEKKEKVEKKGKQVDVKPMQNYIKLALGRGMKKPAIAKKLIAQGWDGKVVKKELGIK